MTSLWIYHVMNNNVFVTKAQVKIEVINEVFNMLISYTFLMFTDFLADLDMRYRVGWFTIFLIIILILTNIYAMVKAQIISS
jgi:hypothetical protein